MFRVRSALGAEIMAKPHETLEKIGLLRSLDRKDREIFDQRCQWRHAHPKEWLLEQNDSGTDIFFLSSGVVRVLITPSPDREIILGDIEAQSIQVLANIETLTTPAEAAR